MAKTAKKAETKHERSERYIRGYQRLCVYCAIPGILDFFSVILGLWSANAFQSSFYSGLTNLLLPIFSGLGMAALALIPSFIVGAGMVTLGLFGAKGKEWCAIVMAGFYGADMILYLVLFFANLHALTSPMILGLAIRVLFLVLFVFLLLYMAKAKKSLRDEYSSKGSGR